MYLPELRRVRRISVANRSDAFWGTDIDIDSIWYFNAKPGYWTWRILAEKDILMVAHSGLYQDRGVWGAQRDGSGGAVAFMWSEDVTWERRPVWVVEGLPTGYNQYAFSKRVIYVDREYYNGTFSDMYDQGGELWKSWTQVMNISKKPNTTYMSGPNPDGGYDEEQVFTHNGGVMDMQLTHASMWDCPPGYKENYVPKYDWYFNTAKDWNTPETFTINYLIRSAR